MRIRQDEEQERSTWQRLRDFGTLLDLIGFLARLVWALGAFLWGLVAD